MNTAIGELILFLENCIGKEKDPAELDKLYRTLIIAKKVEEKRKNLVCV